MLRQYREASNYLNFLPEVPGAKCSMRSVSRYIDKTKIVRETEFIDRDAVRTCLSLKADITSFVSKRFGKPRIWRHAGRVIPPRLDNELRSYWS